MTDFYGESLGVSDVATVSGAPSVSWDDVYYHYDGKSGSMAAGSSIVLNVDPAGNQQPDPDAVISWALELGPGTSGTVRLRSGLDTDWNLTPGAATAPLGEHAVSGASTLAAPTSITAGDLTSRVGMPTLVIECVAGSVELVQVKLRVWPAAGAKGAWVAHPGSIEETNLVDTFHAGGVRVGASVGGMNDTRYLRATMFKQAYQDALLAAQGQLWSHSGDTIEFVQGVNAGGESSNWAASVGIAGDDAVYQGQASQVDAPGYLVARPDRYDVTPPDSGFDPNEIRGESKAHLRSLDGAVGITFSFVRWTGTLTASYQTGAVSGRGSDWPRDPAVVHQFWVDETGLIEQNGKIYGTYQPHTCEPTDPLCAKFAITRGRPDEQVVQEEIQINPRAGAVVGLAMRPQGLLQGEMLPSAIGPEWTTSGNSDGGQWSDSATASLSIEGGSLAFERLTYELEVPPFLYYSPTAQPDRPRFFWKDELDQWRVIGPGKPADDPVLLRIKTALGWYREPRHGEDVDGHGAHPLKVKVDHGYGPDVWDTPVWMTPRV